MSDDEEMVQVVVNVPKTTKETAKEKLPYGGITNEVRDTLTRIAFGEDLNQRSRLERQRDELKDELEDLRAERRRLDTDIENKEQRISSIDDKLGNITTKEDKFEAKIEELEAMIRKDGTRVWPSHGGVRRAAKTGGVEPEGVIETLKERNPDVPNYVYQQALHDRETWSGLPDSIAELEVDEREPLE